MQEIYGEWNRSKIKSWCCACAHCPFYRIFLKKTLRFSHKILMDKLTSVRCKSRSPRRKMFPVWFFDYIYRAWHDVLFQTLRCAENRDNLIFEEVQGSSIIGRTFGINGAYEMDTEAEYGGFARVCVCVCVYTRAYRRVGGKLRLFSTFPTRFGCTPI